MNHQFNLLPPHADELTMRLQTVSSTKEVVIDRPAPKPPKPRWKLATQIIKALLRPKDMNRLQYLSARKKEMPMDLNTESQALGRYNTGCGATHGIMERCNFRCTACYLGKEANHQPPLPFLAATEQLDRLASYLGPGGNVQITSGEVTLLPQVELARLILHATSKGLSPMVMSHGDVVIRQPAYLEYLVTHGGLTKISFHVDMTQRGRFGFPKPQSEAEQNQVRDSLANLLRNTRKKTGVKLKAATTITLNRNNIGQLKTVTEWFFNNLDTFRILSIQPQARTGRTLTDDGIKGPEAWSALESAVGMKLNPHPITFGHPECTRLAFFLAVISTRKRVFFQAVRPNNMMDRTFMDRFLSDFAGINVNDQPVLLSLALIIGNLIRHPRWWWNLPLYSLRRIWQERSKCSTAIHLLLSGRARIRVFAFVIHSFMDREELTTPVGLKRLAACAFKLSVNGKMVSMCEMNGTTLREETYLKRSVV